MKKLLGLLILIGATTMAQAQTGNVENSRKVATKGFAEREVTPDIIYLSINLKEFYIDGNTKKKVLIETLEKQLYDAAIANGVKKEDFTIQNVYSYNHNVKKKGNELLQARQYRLKIADLNNLDVILDKVDPFGIESTSISGYDHSQKKEIEKELKTEAVKDARRNAEILAEADQQGVGKALVINDNSSMNFNDLIPQPRVMSYAKAADASVMESSGNGLNIDIRPIKLTCYIDVVFELK
ncbi:SIMPL domain-containing protein [Sphingobacterium pedocola]|uniref:SIMPL domain-containing protein n=1 Tax=Sphingobacterium pedocola TaxID=2082722 RepID=A0ABR9T7V8_9SPHI|nr:SIMPL domain-containing protein [Sphingobacterium pedocola]MBE8721415.1 SIMPL domain-containing protein [Sphingobacterium pedocola]